MRKEVTFGRLRERHDTQVVFKKHPKQNKGKLRP
jgi:hypothetical protein